MTPWEIERISGNSGEWRKSEYVSPRSFRSTRKKSPGSPRPIFAGGIGNPFNVFRELSLHRGNGSVKLFFIVIDAGSNHVF